MEVVKIRKQLWAGLGILGKQKLYLLALPSFSFTVKMHTCNMTKVSPPYVCTRLAIGIGQLFMIYAGRWYLILKVSVQEELRNSVVFLGEPVLPAAHQTLLCSAVRSPERNFLIKFFIA